MSSFSASPLEKANPQGVIDISGTYISDIISTDNHGLTLKSILFDPKSGQKPEVKIVQNGRRITGTYDDGRGQIWGAIEGDTIRFDYVAHSAHTGKGIWKVKPGGSEITGTFMPLSPSEAKRGEWNLTRSE